VSANINPLAEQGGVTIKGNNCRKCGSCVYANTPGNRIEGNVITRCSIGLELTDGASLFAGNLFYGIDIAVVGGGGHNVDGGGNVIIPGIPFVPNP